jgi:hypothetical protein
MTYETPQLATKKLHLPSEHPEKERFEYEESSTSLRTEISV